MDHGVYLVTCFSNSGLLESPQLEGFYHQSRFLKNQLSLFMKLKSEIVFQTSLFSVKCCIGMILPDLKMKLTLSATMITVTMRGLN